VLFSWTANPKSDSEINVISVLTLRWNLCLHIGPMGLYNKITFYLEEFFTLQGSPLAGTGTYSQNKNVYGFTLAYDLPRELLMPMVVMADIELYHDIYHRLCKLYISLSKFSHFMTLQDANGHSSPRVIVFTSQ
jgi:hypothetical protein